MGSQPNYNILLVEDDVGHAALINRAFEAESHCRLVTTTTLEQARSLIILSTPDLIITDVQLPDGHGTELLDQGLVQRNFMLCINISSRQLSDAQFADNIQSQLERINVPSENINLEVTEHNIIHNLDDAILRMQELISRGISFRWMISVPAIRCWRI